MTVSGARCAAPPPAGLSQVTQAAEITLEYRAKIEYLKKREAMFQPLQGFPWQKPF